MRGKVTTDRVGVAGVGITPACAGKRAFAAASRSLRRDHPRMCGEKPRGVLCRQSGGGSPPHVRGKGFHCVPCNPCNRITPACAGKSCLHGWRSGRNGDHPRMCGEKYSRISRIPTHKGSPPHVRGKVTRKAALNLNKRITPACAGKSIPTERRAARARDHPRMCGEKYASTLTEKYLKGSPPHVRGKAPF